MNVDFTGIARELWHDLMDATPEEFDAAAEGLALYGIDVDRIREERAAILEVRRRRAIRADADDEFTAAVVRQRIDTEIKRMCHPDLSRITDWPDLMDATPEEFDAAAEGLALYGIDVDRIREERAAILEVRRRRAIRADADDEFTAAVVRQRIDTEIKRMCHPDLSRITDWPSTRDDADRATS